MPGLLQSEGTIPHHSRHVDADPRYLFPSPSSSSSQGFDYKYDSSHSDVSINGDFKFPSAKNIAKFIDYLGPHISEFVTPAQVSSLNRYSFNDFTLLHA